MGFLKKTGTSNKNEQIRFLGSHGFKEKVDSNKNVVYTMQLSSANNLYNNIVTVSVDGGKINVENFQKFSVGGYVNELSKSIDVEDATEDDILNMINDVLPEDLD